MPKTTAEKIINVWSFLVERDSNGFRNSSGDLALRCGGKEIDRSDSYVAIQLPDGSVVYESDSDDFAFVNISDYQNLTHWE